MTQAFNLWRHLKRTYLFHVLILLGSIFNGDFSLVVIIWCNGSCNYRLPCNSWYADGSETPSERLERWACGSGDEQPDQQPHHHLGTMIVTTAGDTPLDRTTVCDRRSTAPTCRNRQIQSFLDEWSEESALMLQWLTQYPTPLASMVAERC